jgi:endonuclease YncB( thermonuclease family)
VTPGHQTSPLAQQTPLQREEGNAQPWPPKRPDLPKFFRKVVAKEATHLVATVSKKPVDLHLAHVTGPSSDQNCHMFGQQAPCTVLARTALQRFLRGRGISCDISKEDLEVYQDRTQEQKPLTGLCVLGRLNKASSQSQTKRKQQDLAEWLVRYGWAIPDEGYYQEALKEAKRAKRGLYADGTATSRDSTPSSLPAAASTTLDRLAQEAIRPSLEDNAALPSIATTEEDIILERDEPATDETPLVAPIGAAE